ncbi:MAG: sigma-54-dependent transcriptional regulator [Sandaracinaceae bacterium]
MASVLIVEDDRFESRMMEQYLTRAGHHVSPVSSAEAAIEALGLERVDVVVTDLHLPGMNGIELLRQLAQGDAPPVIVVTGDTEVSVAVDAMRAGAADYVTKPLTMKSLDHVLTRVIESARLRRRVRFLQREVLADPDPSQTARSQAMRETLTLAERSASSDAPLLLVGESGVGKEVVAAHVHRQSTRAAGPFVRLNVAAMPDTMIEAELFGAVRGAFTDARQDRAGFFATAESGTLLLDEIAELRPELQTKLLRALETRRYYPVGARREAFADVRIIAATNRDPEEAVDRGQLRADLYYRLASMVIRVPALRERTEDIAPLASELLRQYRAQTHRGPSRFTADALELLERQRWPGNVRELRNLVERVALLHDGEAVDRNALTTLVLLGSRHGTLTAAAPTASVVTTPAHESPPTAAFAPRPLDLVIRDVASDAERAHLIATLAHTSGNRTHAARLLGISRSTLWKKLKDHGIDAAD